MHWLGWEGQLLHKCTGLLEARDRPGSPACHHHRQHVNLHARYCWHGLPTSLPRKAPPSCFLSSCSERPPTPWLPARCAFRRLRTPYRPQAGTPPILTSDPLFYLPCYLLRAARIIDDGGAAVIYYDGLEVRLANYSVKALVRLEGPRNTTNLLVLDRIWVRCCHLLSSSHADYSHCCCLIKIRSLN